MALTNPQGKLIVLNDAGKRISFPVTGTTLSTTGSTDVNAIFAPIVTRGLVSWWKLEESSASANAVLDTALSDTGVGASPANNGTSFGTTPYTISGKLGNAHKFTGDGYVQVANAASLNPDTFTFSAWIYNTSFNSGSNAIAAKSEGNPNVKWWFSTNPNGSLTSGNTDGTDDITSSSGLISLNQWYYVTVTKSNVSPFTKKIYINGVQVGSVNGVVLPTGDTHDFFIGGRPSHPGYSMIGYIDEALFYNTVLTSAEINQNYQSYSNTFVTTNLRSLYKLEEGSLAGNAVLDTAYSTYGVGSNPGNHGTRFGTAPLSDLGISGNAHSFSGDDYITLTNESAFDFDRLTPFSLSAWVNPTNFSGQKRIIVKFSSGFIGWDFMISSATGLRFGLHGGPTNGTNEIDTVSSGTTMVANKWYHVCVTYNGNSSFTGVKFYIDGILQTTSDNSGGATLTTTTLNNSQVQIGINYDLSGEPFTGLIDEVAVYTAELTQAQVLQNFRYYSNTITTSGLVSWWRFNNTLTDSAFSSAGEGANPGNNGSMITGSTSYVTSQSGFEPGKGKNGVNVNGSNTISMGTGGSTPANLQQASTFTWEWRWNHVASFSGGGGSFGVFIGNGAASSKGFIIEEVAGSGNLYISIKTTTGSTFTSQVIATGVNEYWSVSYDGANVKIYRNGFLVDTFAKTGNVDYDNSGGAGLFFLSRGDGVTGLDAGTTVDFIRSYNRALTATEIFQNYSSGL